MSKFVATDGFYIPKKDNTMISIMGPKEIGVTALFERILFKDVFTDGQIPSVCANIKENTCFPDSERRYNLFAETHKCYDVIENIENNDNKKTDFYLYCQTHYMNSILLLFQDAQSKGSWERTKGVAMKLREKYGSTKRIYGVESMCDMTHRGEHHISPFETQLFDDIFHVSAYKDTGIKEMLIKINHDTRGKKPTKSAAFTKM
jgi:hypothetical protein